MKALRLITIAAASGWLALAHQRNANPDVVVHFDVEAPVSPVPFQIAKNVATSMFAEIGVRVAWTEDPYPSDGCSGETVRIHLRLVTQMPREFQPGALASALPFQYCRQSISVMY